MHHGRRMFACVFSSCLVLGTIGYLFAQAEWHRYHHEWHQTSATIVGPPTYPASTGSPYTKRLVALSTPQGEGLQSQATALWYEPIGQKTTIWINNHGLAMEIQPIPPGTASDVLIGAVIGLLIGFYVFLLLDVRRNRPLRVSSTG